MKQVRHVQEKAAGASRRSSALGSDGPAKAAANQGGDCMVRKTKHHDIEKLKDVIDGMDTAMLTTVTAQGKLVSRPLRMQEIDEEGAMWFVTDRDSHKTEEIQANPQVNLSFAAPRDNTYVSVSGKATVLFDKARLNALWSPAMMVFYPDGLDDPSLCLLRVDLESAEYWDSPGGLVGNALYLAMAAVTGDAGALSENRSMDLES
jgi:general stress protein 26